MPQCGETDRDVWQAGEWLCTCVKMIIVAIDLGVGVYLFKAENCGYQFWHGLRGGAD